MGLTSPSSDNDGNSSDFSGIEELRTICRDGSVKSASWLPNSDQLSYLTNTGSIFLFDLPSGKTDRLVSNKEGDILSFSWSPDGQILAVSFSDKSVRFFDRHTKESVRNFQSRTYLAQQVYWSPSGDQIAWVTSQGIELRFLSFKHSITLSEHSRTINTCEWSPNGRILASCSDDQTIRLWNDRGNAKVLASHFGPVLNITWSPTGRTLVSSSSDATIRFWSPRRGKELGHLEGHTSAVLSVAFSPDGRILISSSQDGSIRLWRSDNWEALASIMDFANDGTFVNTLAFHPSKNLLLTISGGPRGELTIWKVDLERVLNSKVTTPSVRYTNAKVVMVGDTGVGKSGLGLVLSGRPFVPTESTHSRHVWTMERVEVSVEDGRTEIRETLLWDLAGQPGYRLIHQLYLREISVALVLFDARSETKPFAGVQHW